MNQEKVSKFIKDVRLKNNLSQKEFADKYGVTFQAVSKWENGKNIPDIGILKEICKDYNMDLNELLETNIKRKKILFIIGVVGLIVVIVLVIALLIGHEHKFEFKTLSATCDNFTLYGSMAYNDKTSSIYISNITYCGGDDVNIYKEIICVLYEKDGGSYKQVSTCNHKDNKNITLEEFLKDVSFKVDNYKSTCGEYKENSLYLEINAKKDDDSVNTFEIPLKLEDNC